MIDGTIVVSRFIGTCMDRDARDDYVPLAGADESANYSVYLHEPRYTIMRILDQTVVSRYLKSRGFWT